MINFVKKVRILLTLQVAHFFSQLVIYLMFVDVLGSETVVLNAGCLKVATPTGWWKKLSSWHFSILRVSVTALRGDHFPPRLHMFRNYPAPYERMERLVSELLEARSPRVAASTSSTTSTDASTPTRVTDNPMTTDVPYKRLLNTFLRDLFGETIHEVGHGGEDESDLQESIVSLLSSFSRRYMYSSKGVEQPVPISEQVGWRWTAVFWKLKCPLFIEKWENTCFC